MSNEINKDEEILTQDTEAKVQPDASEAIEDTAEAAAEKTAENSELDKVKAELSELNDRHLRMAAEYDNFRKRSIKEREAIHGDAVCYAVTKLLPVFDNLERALAQETADAEYKKGVEMIYNQFKESLDALKVTEIEATAGTEFDPYHHNAVMHVEDEALGENQIAEVFQKGFKIGEKVVRHAVVKVAN